MSSFAPASGYPRAALLMAAFLALCANRLPAHDNSPLELVRDTSSRMLIALQDQSAVIASDPAALDRLVADIVLPYFDFRRMSQWALGKYWRTATAQQRESFVMQFRALLVRTYGRALSDYAGEKVIYFPVGDEPGADKATVRTEIELSDNSSVPVAYSMYLGVDGWKVYDVAFNGASLVTNYRSSFGRIIRAEGMDSLIRQMQRRNTVQDSG